MAEYTVRQRFVFVTNSLTVCVLVSLQESEYDYDYDDPPVNCLLTESIKGGHVTYSKVLYTHTLTKKYVYTFSFTSVLVRM